MLPNNLVAFVVTLFLAITWLRLNDFLAHRGLISTRLSRKIIHVGTGPIYVLCWLLFQDEPTARFLAALIPFGITLQFALVGMGILHDQAAVKAMSRSGERREILRGPLFYGIAFILLTVIYWKNSPIGISALMILCGGDGIADVVGSRFGHTRIPWSKEKSWIGSLTVLVGGFLFSSAILEIYSLANLFSIPATNLIPGLFLIAFVAAAVESLPYKDIDNLTVPLAASFVGHIVFQGTYGSY